MKRNFLEELGITEKEIIDRILDENSGDIGRAKGEYDSVSKELEGLKAQLADRDKQLIDLKKASGDNEELKKQIETLQKENKAQSEAHSKELHKLRVDTAVEMALTSSKARNNTAVRALLKDLDKAELADDGTVKGLQEQIAALANDEKTSFFFDTADNTQPVLKGLEPVGGGTAGTDTSQMTYSQMMDYLAQNPGASIQ